MVASAYSLDYITWWISHDGRKVFRLLRAVFVYKFIMLSVNCSTDCIFSLRFCDYECGSNWGNIQDGPKYNWTFVHMQCTSVVQCRYVDHAAYTSFCTSPHPREGKISSQHPTTSSTLSTRFGQLKRVTKLRHITVQTRIVMAVTRKGHPFGQALKGYCTLNIIWCQVKVEYVTKIWKQPFSPGSRHIRTADKNF